MESNKRNISEETLNKVVARMPKIIQQSLPDTPENLLPYAKRLKTPNISPNINDKVKKMMLENLLDDEDYLSTYYSILASYFSNKTPETNPTIYLILGQTGSGKSNLTAKVLKENPNTVVIDSDKYKQFRPDSEILATKEPTLYGFLTGPDAYDHRDNIYDYASNNQFNILFEIAPSMKNGLFIVDLEDLKKKGYNIETHVLSVSKLNSALSVHERYEGQIEAELATPKLTDLNRHNESFDALMHTLRQLQNNSNLDCIKVYERAKNPEDFPTLVYSNKGEESTRYSCPYEALMVSQAKDEKETLREFSDRYSKVLDQMRRRSAVPEQYEQLGMIYKMYQEKMNTKINSDKGKEDN